MRPNASSTNALMSALERVLAGFVVVVASGTVVVVLVEVDVDVEVGEVDSWAPGDP